VQDPAVVDVDGSAAWPALAALLAHQAGTVRVVALRFSAVRMAEPADDASDTGRAAVLGWLRRPDVLSLAVLTGSPSPRSLTMATCCDVLIAAHDVVISLSPSVEPGLIGALIARVGPGVAGSLVLAGRTLDAAESLSLGLIDQIAPPDQLDAVVDELAGRLLSVDRPIAAELKSLLRRSAAPRIALSADFESRDRLAAGRARGAG
jgi:hypothetical protein